MVINTGIRTTKDKGRILIYKVSYRNDNFRVEYDGINYNVSLWYSPKRRHFKDDKEFIEAESVDAETFFNIVDIVRKYRKG